VLGSGVDRGVRLTPLHVECLKQCLLGRRREQYERVAAAAAAVVGEARFDSLGTMVAAPRGRAVMEYSLYAGMVCVGAGDVARAARLWTAVFALPSKHASAIQIAAYKRLVLAELELGGRRAQLPGCFAAAHARTVESQAAAYGALADAFAARSMAGAVERLAAMRATLVADGNAGLGARVMQAAPAHFVRRVGRAYARVTVGRLVDLTGFRAHPLAAGGGDPHERLAQYVREMGDPAVALLDAGPAATAAPRDLVVCFADPAATAAAALPPAERARREELWAGRLAAKAREADGLRARLDGIDRHLALTKEHVTSMRDQPATS
ncbi:COP9 signalosome complex subunit 3, partial [Coemansia nantahalensis]